LNNFSTHHYKCPSHQNIPLLLKFSTPYPNSHKKSPGYDLITSEILKQLQQKVTVLLTYILNSMLRPSYFPVLWKYSSIILILKPNKPPDLPSSYRPINLLPISKVFEKILIKRILNIIDKTKVLPHSQFGFHSKHSTVH